MFVWEVRGVDGLGHKPHPGIFDAETLHERFKSAVISHVTETTRAEHVKRNGVRMPTRVFVEREFCLRIDVAQDQPRGRNPADPWMGTSDPGPSGVVFRVLFPDLLFSGAVITLELPHRLFDPSAHRRPETINF